MAKSSNIKVRFNLSAGKNYMKWKVEYPDRKPEYYDPKEFQLVLGGCTLKNHKTTAQKIHQGANKTVCAKIACDVIRIVSYKQRFLPVTDLPRLKYNPRVATYWNLDGVDVDNKQFKTIISAGNQLFIYDGWDIQNNEP